MIRACHRCRVPTVFLAPRRRVAVVEGPFIFFVDRFRLSGPGGIGRRGRRSPWGWGILFGLFARRGLGLGIRRCCRSRRATARASVVETLQRLVGARFLGRRAGGGRRWLGDPWWGRGRERSTKLVIVGGWLGAHRRMHQPILSI